MDLRPRREGDDRTPSGTRWPSAEGGKTRSGVDGRRDRFLQLARSSTRVRFGSKERTRPSGSAWSCRGYELTTVSNEMEGKEREGRMDKKIKITSDSQYSAGRMR
jgi:hypothetical protein